MLLLFGAGSEYSLSQTHLPQEQHYLNATLKDFSPGESKPKYGDRIATGIPDLRQIAGSITSRARRRRRFEEVSSLASVTRGKSLFSQLADRLTRLASSYASVQAGSQGAGKERGALGYWKIDRLGNFPEAFIIRGESTSDSLKCRKPFALRRTVGAASGVHSLGDNERITHAGSPRRGNRSRLASGRRSCTDRTAVSTCTGCMAIAVLTDLLNIFTTRPKV